MYTKENAVKINNWVRIFYGGKNADGGTNGGTKSDNKRYQEDPTAGIVPNEDKKAKRNSARDQSAVDRNTFYNVTLPLARKLGASTATPAQVGKIIVDNKSRAGNCAEMTRLVCYGFSRSNLHIWLVTIKDPGDHQFCILAKNEPVFSSIQAMDYLGEDQWIVDPWANIVCKPGNFSGEFGDKMKKWTGQGKRVGVVDKINGGYIWTPGSDQTYLSDITTSGLEYKKGWSF
jgi:hypothetical protein